MPPPCLGSIQRCPRRSPRATIMRERIGLHGASCASHSPSVCSSDSSSPCPSCHHRPPPPTRPVNWVPGIPRMGGPTFCLCQRPSDHTRSHPNDHHPSNHLCRRPTGPNPTAHVQWSHNPSQRSNANSSQRRVPSRKCGQVTVRNIRNTLSRPLTHTCARKAGNTNLTKLYKLVCNLQIFYNIFKDSVL